MFFATESTLSRSALGAYALNSPYFSDCFVTMAYSPACFRYLIDTGLRARLQESIKLLSTRHVIGNRVMESSVALAKVVASLESFSAYESPLYRGESIDGKISYQIESIFLSRYKSETLAQEKVQALCCYFCPIVDTSDARLLSVFIEPSHIGLGRRTSGKPAKILAKILPGVTTQEKEAFAVWWKDHILLPREGLTIQETQSGKEIARVYTDTQARANDPSLTARGWKSLSASCMRYDFDHLPCHPVKAYGSGDFTLFWVENSQGHIAARVIVATRRGRFVPGPIYTNSNVAGDLLEKHIQALKALPREGEDSESNTWINCRLDKIEHNGGFVLPYLDTYQGAKEIDSHIKICSRLRADFELSDTSGVVYPNGGFVCNECDERLHEDDSFQDDNGTCYCESCYSERFAMCDHCYGTTLRDDMVNILDWRGRSVDCACSYCVNRGELDCVEIDRDFYEVDSIVFDSDDIAHVLDSGTYFVSDLTGETHAIEQEHKLPNGDSCTIFEAVSTGNWTLVSEKIGVRLVIDQDGRRYEVEKKIPKLLLKPWLELDEYGDVINRQPELIDVGLPGVDCEMEIAA